LIGCLAAFPELILKNLVLSFMYSFEGFFLADISISSKEVLLFQEINYLKVYRGNGFRG